MSQRRARRTMNGFGLVALAAVPLAFALGGCAQPPLPGSGGPEPGPSEESGSEAPLGDGIVLAAVAAISPDPCVGSAADAYRTSSLNPDRTTRCTTIKPDEMLEINGGTVQLATGTDDNAIVELALDQGDEFAALTAAVSVRTAPENQIAIIIDDEVVSAPTVMTEIDGGELQLAGDDMEAMFEALSG